MKAHINGVDVEGTPEEIAQYARLVNGGYPLPDVVNPNTFPQYPNPYVDGRGWWRDTQITCAELPPIDTYNGVPCTVLTADNDANTRYITDQNGRRVVEKFVDGRWRYDSESIVT